MAGDIAYEMATTFTMDILSSSSAPPTSASAHNLVAGGPVGINIKTNQSIGSQSSQFAFEATK